MSPFDYVDLVLHKKKQDGDLDFVDYAPFIVNRSLSYHLDCILHAQEMNLWPALDKDMQYQYQAAFVADHEINLIACLTEIMIECEFK